MCNLLDQLHARVLSVLGFTGSSYVKIRQILIFGAMLFLMVSAASAEWTVTPITQVGGSYDSNFNRTNDEEELYRVTFTGGLNSTIETDRWSTVFNGRYYGTRAIGRSDLDQDTGTVDVLSSYLTENSTWGLNGGVAITEPNSSELETGNQEFEIVTRINWHVGPIWDWSINEQNSLSLAYDYSSVAYSDAGDSQNNMPPPMAPMPPMAMVPTNNFDDFTAHTASALLAHQYTESTHCGIFIDKDKVHSKLCVIY